MLKVNALADQGGLGCVEDAISMGAVLQHTGRRKSKKAQPYTPCSPMAPAPNARRTIS
ncbi:hypothetical protein C4K04_3412 [Pseudomonas chlororaphis]|uniref:Uncharacterized protein n=1 Tax=Pseudomonas chlororaphis TaxID=587753 RepID=A0A3G7TPN8_9PSED|nr:hypothetical protein C4K04_3412 [Pseudomonas chlororaphis]